MHERLILGLTTFTAFVHTILIIRAEIILLKNACGFVAA